MSLCVTSRGRSGRRFWRMAALQTPRQRESQRTVSIAAPTAVCGALPCTKTASPSSSRLFTDKFYVLVA